MGVEAGTIFRVNWKAARQFRVIKNLLYSQDLMPANFSLFPSVKRELASKTLIQETLKKEWEGAVRTLSGANFATAFSRWYERCEKCVRIPGGYVEKN
jgi:hypothetical protein